LRTLRESADEIEGQLGLRAWGRVLMSGRAGAHWLWLSFGVLAADRATKFAIEHYTSDSSAFPIFSDIVI